MQYSNCALNKPINRGSKTCVPKQEMSNYLAKSKNVFKILESSGNNVEKSFMKDVCGHECTNDELMEILSYSTVQRLKYIYEISYKPEWDFDDPYYGTSSANIVSILNQFMYWKPEFYSMGDHTSDFMTTNPEIFIDFDYMAFALDPTKRYIGFITDEVDFISGGQHAYAVLIDTKLGLFETMDSGAIKHPTNDIDEYYEFVKYKLSSLFPLSFKRNKKRYQNFSSSECAIYALYFIWARLLGKTMDEISKMKLENDYMREFRNVFFRY